MTTFVINGETLQYTITGVIDPDEYHCMPSAPRWKYLTVFHNDHHHRTDTITRLFTYEAEETGLTPVDISIEGPLYTFWATKDGAYIGCISGAKINTLCGQTTLKFVGEHPYRADGFPDKAAFVAHPSDLRLSEHEAAALSQSGAIYTQYIDSYNKRRYFVKIRAETMSLIIELSGMSAEEYRPLLDLFCDIYCTEDKLKIEKAPHLLKTASTQILSGYNLVYEGSSYNVIRVLKSGKPIIHTLLIKAVRTHALLDFPKGGFVWFPNGE